MHSIYLLFTLYTVQGVHLWCLCVLYCVNTRICLCIYFYIRHLNLRPYMHCVCVCACNVYVSVCVHVCVCVCVHIYVARSFKPFWEPISESRAVGDGLQSWKALGKQISYKCGLQLYFIGCQLFRCPKLCLQDFTKEISEQISKASSVTAILLLFCLCSIWLPCTPILYPNSCISTWYPAVVTVACSRCCRCAWNQRYDIYLHVYVHMYSIIHNR